MTITDPIMPRAAELRTERTPEGNHVTFAVETPPPDPVDPVEAERRRLDEIGPNEDGSYPCFCGFTVQDARGWGSHRTGHLNAAARGETFKPRPKKKPKPAANKPTSEPKPEPAEEQPTVEEACTALVRGLTGRTTLDMEHVELVAGWIDHTRAVVAALGD